MGEVDEELIPISEMNDDALLDFMKENMLSLSIEEARKIPEKLNRDPTITELHIFNIEWSEHCSYKSSREILKLLPTKASNVILGPKEDAGIIFFTEHKGERYGIVFGHESHNHPSQVVPFEGAATGIGGIVRDISCMGAKVIACADPLRFGNPFGKNANRTKYIANSVVDGIAGYGNPMGVPVIAGDVYFNESFDDNCLVNVVCLGIVKEKEIVHSTAPENSEGYDVILVGKATDCSGFGGAAFASLILDEEEKEKNKGAVQVPDPFLKNIILRANLKAFEAARTGGYIVGFKDCGAGGLMCASSELASDGGYGIEINLDKVHTSVPDLKPFVIACAETQERFVWISPKEFTPEILRIYNSDFELSEISKNAKASIIGKIIKEQDFIILYKGKSICNAPIKEVTRGIKYEREQKESKKKFNEPDFGEPTDYNQLLKLILSHPNVASRRKIYKHYDTEVQGNTIIRPGEGDAGLIAPLFGSKAGVALSVDHNPRYSRIDPFWGGINAVFEAMRNVACVGAIPSALTDCLNFGNPEKPEIFHGFVQSVKGIAFAAETMKRKGTNEPVPFISGNVSFYNESKEGKTIDPSPIIACIGIIEDYSKAITFDIKSTNSKLFLIGKRKDELGGSVYYDTLHYLGAKIPKPNLEEGKNQIYSILELIDRRILLSCHDISDGGFISCLSEMLIGENGKGIIGAEIKINSGLRIDKELFSETPGFIIEIYPEHEDEMRAITEKIGIESIEIGKTNSEGILTLIQNRERIIDISVKELSEAWLNGLERVLK